MPSELRWVQVVLHGRGDLVRNIGDGNPQPVSAVAWVAEWIDLALRGYCQMPQRVTGADPEVRALLRERLAIGGRPRLTAEHSKWLQCFKKHLALNDDFEPVDGERKLNMMEISNLVKLELGLSVTPHAIWDAVKRHIPRS